MLKVMIAEDDLLMADMLEEVLIESGYEVCGIARTVEEGVELGNRCKPDLAILDIRLAEGGLGTDIAVRLDRRGSLGVLYASANAGHMRLTKADGEACLGKPYRAIDIVRALEIVEQIISTGEASRPFPKGFYVLNGSSGSSAGAMTSVSANQIDNAHARLAAIVESSNDAIISKDLDGIVLSWNGAAERLFGYTAAEMIGRRVTIIFLSDRMEEEEAIIDRISHGGTVEHYDTTRRRKDGRVVRVSATISPMRDASGKIDGVSMIARDLADLDDREGRIRELQAELTHVQRLTELGQVVTTLVHEVNQPITAIRNYVNASRRLAAAGNLTGVQAALERMEVQTKRASDIIQRIRDFAMKRAVKMQAEDLSLVVDESVALISASLADEMPMLTVQVGSAETQVEIDKVQVQQVLFNLMRNGIEAMQDQPRRELMVATKSAPRGMVEISVADTGPGLPNDVRSRLFQPFVTTKSTGMGVGLSVCQGIVQLHGGRIWADDYIGGGTVFRFTVRRAGGALPVIAPE